MRSLLAALASLCLLAVAAGCGAASAITFFAAAQSSTPRRSGLT